MGRVNGRDVFHLAGALVLMCQNYFSQRDKIFYLFLLVQAGTPQFQLLQVGRRPNSIVLLRQMKPSEFTDAEEFRQIKLLEAGLILHPSLPLDRQHAAVLWFREVMRATKI
jgi:hypothetical protein